MAPSWVGFLVGRVQAPDEFVTSITVGQWGGGHVAVVGVALALAAIGLAVEGDDPIAALARKVRRAAAGHDEDFDIDRSDEIGELYDAVDDLVAASNEHGRDLAAVGRYRERLSRITADPDLDDEAKIDRLLELGCERLGVENGLVTRIDEATGRYEVVTAVGSDFVREGTVSDLEETFCRKTITSDDVLGIYDAVEEGYGEDPGHRRWSIGCYVGAKLLVGDGLYGTLCFVHEEPRERPFTESEKEFVDLMSRWVSHALERREHVAQLRLADRAFESAPFGVAITDPTAPDNPIVRVNDAFERITGYDENEVTGRNCRFLQGPETDREPVTKLRDAIEAREQVSVELRNYRKDGSVFWNRVHVVPVWGSDGQLANTVGFVEDVTERRERDRELRRHREYTEDVLDAVDDVFYLVDDDWRLRRWNQSFVDVTGYGHAELEAVDVREFFDERDAERIVAALADIENRVGEPLEATIRTADGESIPYEFVAAPLENPEGERMIAGIGRDITERKRYEGELERTADLLQQAGRIAQFGGWELDATKSPPEMTWTDELYEIHDLPPETRIDVETAIDHYHPEDRAYIQERLQMALEYGRGYDMEVRALTADGDVRWVRALGEAVEADGEVVKLRGAVQDITEQKEREFAIQSLHESTRGLLSAETAAEGAEVVIDAAEDALDVAAVAIFLYDDAQNHLEPTAVSAAFDEYCVGEPTAVGPDSESVLWNAFVTDSQTVIEDAAEGAGAPFLGPIDHGLAMPIGAHGAFLAVDRAGGLDADTRRLAETLVASAEAAFDRIQSERRLRERDAELERRNERLRRQIRVTETIRSVDRTLIGATDQADLEAAVCEQLVDGETIAFAWIGGFDSGGKRVVPRAWSGDAHGYLDEAVLERDANAPEPAVAAIEGGEPVDVWNVADGVREEQWRRPALAANFQSVLAVPLAVDEYRYGVLAAYATEPGTFGDLERTVFAELGETIANAIASVSARQALHTDRVTALTLRLEDGTDPLSGIAADIGGTVTYEGLATQAEDETRLFVSTSGASAEAVASALERRHAVRDYRLVSGDGEAETRDGGERTAGDEGRDARDDGEGAASDGEDGANETARFELTLRGDSIVTRLLRHGGRPRSIVADATGLDVVVDLPLSADVRQFVSMLEAEFTVELRRRNEMNRSPRTLGPTGDEMLAELTDRQLEVLRTAHLAGFFNWPRDATGEDLAEMLDVSQPTINRHLRLAERAIVSQLFDDDPERG